MTESVCRYCYGARLVAWSAAGPHFCRECSRDVPPRDAFTVITAAWREKHHEVLKLRARLQFDPGGSDRIDELEQANAHLRAENTALLACVDKMRAALSLAEVEVSLGRSWCHICRTEERGELRGRDSHPHDPGCVLFDAERRRHAKKVTDL